MPSLEGKTLFITGASRGIGKAIALRAAGELPITANRRRRRA
jgi:citronellol/citronellal dehydrogenase